MKTQDENTMIYIPVCTIHYHNFLLCILLLFLLLFLLLLLLLLRRSHAEILNQFENQWLFFSTSCIPIKLSLFHFFGEESIDNFRQLPSSRFDSVPQVGTQIISPVCMILVSNSMIKMFLQVFVNQSGISFAMFSPVADTAPKQH